MNIYILIKANPTFTNSASKDIYKRENNKRNKTGIEPVDVNLKMRDIKDDVMTQSTQITICDFIFVNTYASVRRGVY